MNLFFDEHRFIGIHVVDKNNCCKLSLLITYYSMQFFKKIIYPSEQFFKYITPFYMILETHCIRPFDFEKKEVKWVISTVYTYSWNDIKNKQTTR